MNLQFLKNINLNNTTNSKIKLYYKLLTKLNKLLKDKIENFSLISFINNFEDIIYLLNQNISDKIVMKDTIEAIIYILNYFYLNKQYIDTDKLDKYIDKYKNLIKLLV